jgi:hypothetical protein
MSNLRRWLATAPAIAGMALVLAACGANSGSGSPGASGSGTAHDPSASTAVDYTSAQYGFSITYSGRLTEHQASEEAGERVDPAFSVYFVDVTGPLVSGQYVNGILVNVYELKRAVRPSEFKEFKSGLQVMVDDLMASLPESEIVQDLTSITVNRVPGYVVRYTYSADGEDLRAITFVLTKGRYEYQITTQATSSDWDRLQGDFENAVGSFAVE